MFRYEPPEPDRKIKTIQPTYPSKKETEVLTHLQKGWLPINPSILSTIQKDILSNKGEVPRETLLGEVKKDPGLYMHCAKNVRLHLEDTRNGVDPIAALKTLEDEKLRALFRLSEKDLSAHKIRSANKSQALRIQHSLLSAHTAEAIAATANIPSDVAFNGAMFRELGLNLIAWNYPQLYTQVFSLHRRTGVEIDAKFKEFLGLSPFEIGARLATDWDISPKIRSSVPSAAQKKGESSIEIPADTLSVQELFEISELFAEVQDPQNFPNATERWKAKESRITKFLEPKILETVKEKVQDILTLYVESPTVASLPLVEERRDSTAPPSRETALFLSNPFVQRCPKTVRDEFQNVYSYVQPGELSVDALRLLADRVVSALGFARGCLFLMAQDGRTLKPALRFGDALLDEYQAFIARAKSSLQGNPYGSAPLKTRGVGIQGKELTYISGALESSKHVGLLYLELSRNSEQDETHQTFLLFHAVRQTLRDCLGQT